MLFGELINKGKLCSSTSVVFAVTLAASLGVLFAPLAKADAMYNWKDVTQYQAVRSKSHVLALMVRN